MGHRRSIGALGLAVALATALAASLPALATAQDTPDVRNIRPAVMLLVDTSGSMERLPGCACSTASCEECLPSCTSSTATDERNRWATFLEALTGSFDGFSCAAEDRSTSSYVGEYDYNYHLPHNDPAWTGQASDGILDAYAERAKFGLMTFDPEPTFKDTDELLYERLFTPRHPDDNQSAPGMYSYGEPKSFTFPGCGEPHMIDIGARREQDPTPPTGRLVSVGSDSDDPLTIANNIENVLLGVRPFGGTPIAGMLDDVRYYFANHPDVAPGSDPWADCRDKYVILLTDGIPTGEMREFGCGTAGYECPYDLSEDIAADLCQFDSGTDSCDGTVQGVFVVGFDIDDPEAQAVLSEIANSGGTGDAMFADDRATLMDRIGRALDTAAPGTTTRTVPAFASTSIFADVQRQMQLNTGFRIPGDSTLPWEGVLDRRRFECTDSLEPEPQTVDESEGDKFHESLNDQTASPAETEFSACPGGKPRCLLTIVPDDLTLLDGHLAGRPCFPDDDGEACLEPLGTSGSVGSAGAGRPRGCGGAPPQCGGPSPGSGGCGGPPHEEGTPKESDLELVGFEDTYVTKEVLGVSTTDRRDEIIDWVYGMAGTVRDDRRLGDIYHSSPVVVGPPEEDLPDESFNLFRQKPEVANRPTVAYVGTNDGVLHAFVVDDTEITEGPHAGTTLEAGTELWGFIPPMFLRKLDSALSSHQFMVDGTPVVKNVFMKRLPGETPDGDHYRTILVTGMRGGGQGYIALDVTDPFEPKFLWQFAHEQMGFTYGEPAVGQVLVDSTDGLHERGMVLLPGGTGEDLTDPDSGCGSAEDTDGDGDYDKPLGCPAQGVGQPPVNEGTRTAVENIPCYDDPGRSLFFIDVGTGHSSGFLDDTVFNAPLTGGISMFPGNVGQVASTAYLTDDAGIIWRVDMSSPNVADWFADPIHDIFEGIEDISLRSPAYHAPVVTTDSQGRVVVIQGTGDIDELDAIAANRVVSITEDITFADDGSVDDTDVSINWEIQLEPSELVTGPLELFQGVAYFGTFSSDTTGASACDFGESKLWGVAFRESEGSATPPLPAPGLPVAGGAPDELQRFVGPFENQLIMGAAITQRPSCVRLEEETLTDPFLGTLTSERVTNQGGGKFELVALTGGDGVHKSGSAIAEADVPEITQPVSFTEVASFAGSIQ